MNSIVIPTITTLEVRNIISSTKNSSHGWDDIPATIAKKCIEYYINPLTHIINTNYRPISILSLFSKIFERIRYNHIVDFMDSNCSIYKYQF